MTATLNVTSTAAPLTLESSSESATGDGLLSAVFANDVVKNLACGAAALAITAALSFAFVQTTEAAPGDRTAAHSSAHGSAHFHLAKLSIQRGHAWFGQTEPAVLVD